MSIHVIKIHNDYHFLDWSLLSANIFVFLTNSFDTHSILIYNFFILLDIYYLDN
jgi:hypothetical protein